MKSYKMEIASKSVRVAFLLVSCGSTCVDEDANVIFLCHNVAREFGEREKEREESWMSRAIAVCVVRTDNSSPPAEPFSYSRDTEMVILMSSLLS